MKIHYRKALRSLNSFIEQLSFRIKAFILGFESANINIGRYNKETILLLLKKYGANIGDNCDIECGLTFHNCKDYSNLVIGNGSHIGKNCFLDLKDKIVIGNNVTLSMGTTLLTHQDLGLSSINLLYPKSQARIKIGDDVYIGANVTILKGVTIGKRSIIGAGSLVINDVLENIIVGGVPAKKIKILDNE